MGYVFAIQVALSMFPALAFLFTLPYILSQYHKYGAVSLYRTIIIYSFIFYMMCIYFLVILPLPDIADVGTERLINLRPFNFIRDFMKETVFRIGDTSTYIPALKQSCVYVVVFNVFMTMPFGIYLRYYFKCGFIKTTILTLLLSAFFEFTQYTGIYFAYPGSYRLCDVDDLIQNTTGGMLGYAVAGLAMKILPSREKIDNRAYKRGENVTGFRRLFMYAIDIAVLLISSSVLQFCTEFQYAAPVMFVVIFIFMPLVTHGRTIGAWIVNLKMDASDRWRLRIVLRHIFMMIYYYVIPMAVILPFGDIKQTDIINREKMIIIKIGILMAVFLFYMIQIIIIMISGKTFYDKLFKITFVNTVKRKVKKDDV